MSIVWRKVRRDLDVDLELGAGGDILWTLHIDQSNFDVLHSVNLPLASTPEDEAPALELRSSGSGNVGFQVVKRYNLPGESLPPARDMVIEVEYDSEGIEVDDILDVRVRLLYTGFKEATGMVIADIGIPTGFAAVRASLDALVEAIEAYPAGRLVILPPQAPLTSALLVRIEAKDHGFVEGYGAQARLDWIFTE